MAESHIIIHCSLLARSAFSPNCAFELLARHLVADQSCEGKDCFVGNGEKLCLWSPAVGGRAELEFDPVPFGRHCLVGPRKEIGGAIQT